jgi:pimeloyl-ACP methyl ester carboxylesterase
MLALMVVAACTSSTNVGTTDQSTTARPTSVTTSLPSTTIAVEHLPIDKILDDLGGEQCPDSDFTCVTLEMPLNHFDPADERTIDVAFAVLPASGDSRGAFVTATGGPGSSGIAVADSYTAALDPAIPGAYDIVFFDQRGLAMSGGLNCPVAAATYYRVDVLTGLGLDEETLAAASATFAQECVEEMGDPEVLPYLGTDQAASDLEVFRETFGFEELILYGESYGTQLSQTYAANHGDHLTRMILDGTVDLTLDGFTFFEQQAAAFGAALQSTLDYCGEDPFCADEIGTGPDEAYDRMVALLVEEPFTVEFPLPGGGSEGRTFGLGDLEVVASAQMYSEDDRMMFLRALAAYTERDDLVPMLRLLYLNLGVDPQDEAVIEDLTYSDAIYYAVECLDYSYPGTTPEERSAAFFEAGSGAEVNRLGTLFYGDFPCAFWPGASQQNERPEPLIASGIPTVVLGSTADPATPYQQGVDVSERLEEGYLMSQAGGPHVIFGRGNPCPDDSVTAFILNGTPPEETVCEGDVVGYYIPLLPVSLDEFDSAEAMLDAVDYEIAYLPEYYWWDTVTTTPVGCNQGGTLTMSATDEGDGFVFEECAFMEGLVLSGEGSYNYDEDVFILEVFNGTADCAYLYERVGIDITVEDNCAGDPFDG